MKKRVYIFILLTLFFAASGAVAASEWSAPKFLIGATHPSMIQDDNGVYWMAFNGAGQGGADIFLMNSTEGRVWSDPWPVTSNPADDRDPQIMQDSEGRFWMVFISNRMGKADLFLKRSDDGVSWSEAVQITTNPAFDSYPNTLIQDRDEVYWIAFTSNRAGSYDVYLTRSGDGVSWSEPSRVTRNESIETFPTMIQDTSGVYWLAFARQTGWPNKYDIFLMSSNDASTWSAPEKISRGAANNNYIDLIQDSGGAYWMAFTSERTGNEDIFVMGSYDGKTWSEPKLLSYNMIDRTRSFKCDYKTLMQDSQDLYWIVYGCAKKPEGLWYVTGRDLELNFSETIGITTMVNTTFGEVLLTQLTTDTYPQGKPSYSVDGRKIVYTSRHDDAGDLWVMDSSGDNKKQVMSLASTQDFAAWRPDGMIIYSSRESGNWDIWVIDPLSGRKGRLTPDSSNQLLASYSPDGKKIVYVSDEAGSNDIWVMDSDTSDKRQLSFDRSHQNVPAWSPDGKRIAFESNQNGNWDLFIMDADGSNIIQLTNETANQGGPTWSPDGKWIAFESNEQGNFDLWVMKADGSEKTRITSDLADEFFPAWSPDGERIAYESLQAGNSDVWVADLSMTVLASRLVAGETETQPLIAQHPAIETQYNATGRLNESLNEKPSLEDNSPWILRKLASIIGFFLKIIKG